MTARLPPPPPTALAKSESEPADTVKVQEFLAHQERSQRQLLKFIGRAFGHGHNAARNVAGATVLICLGTICTYLLLSAFRDVRNRAPSWGDAVEKLIPIFTLAFGYLFGQNRVQDSTEHQEAGADGGRVRR